MSNTSKYFVLFNYGNVLRNKNKMILLCSVRLLFSFMDILLTKSQVVLKLLQLDVTFNLLCALLYIAEILLVCIVDVKYNLNIKFVNLDNSYKVFNLLLTSDNCTKRLDAIIKNCGFST